ncbi:MULTISPECIES: glutamine amidotransferase-related protein [Rahnella]|uniref:CTP synthase (glutamine hydrolyzing) n=1 Tax=Rahnella victoriana TaxID=1510570 RepID=A0ABS0DU91_9GAMM|nr:MULTISPECIES: gamma-glutamyl-gamma-aminobutyrate hydrolase family protein [Rahnella]MBF7956214.1 gamma-glutamyl-gamma-aminobutyrate hydrolase family protein [Rahnella victoriana]TBX35922.1 CTP synthase [Rahnella victoriana]TDS88239.1 glutamine amidotransferase class I [Rahnella sp. BIGb0236]VTQ61763.1 CTP synthase [Campylobacter jejuni]
MAFIFVAHDTPEPSLYGAMAAILAAQKHLPLAHLPVSWDIARYPDACQHVIGEGQLMTSGLLWTERLNPQSAGRVMELDELLDTFGTQDVVIPLGPMQIIQFTHIARQVRENAFDYELINVERSNQGYAFSRHGQIDETAGCWWRDRYGRWINHNTPPQTGTSLRIALVGAQSDQCSVYPATLAALGDAADALSLSLDIVYAAPLALEEHLHEVMENVDGILLPGGAAMCNVAGQICAAHYALNRNIPVLGLCLGMQTMTTALVQKMLGSEKANLTEADPDAEIKTFIPLADTPTFPVHRLGNHLMYSRAGSRLHDILGGEYPVRYNHRFHLDPGLKPALEEYGVQISGTDITGKIADGIEYTRHPFYLGVQGHPELSSLHVKPHPLLMAFLETAGLQRR